MKKISMRVALNKSEVLLSLLTPKYHLGVLSMATWITEIKPNFLQVKKEFPLYMKVFRGSNRIKESQL